MQREIAVSVNGGHDILVPVKTDIFLKFFHHNDTGCCVLHPVTRATFPLPSRLSIVSSEGDQKVAVGSTRHTAKSVTLRIASYTSTDMTLAWELYDGICIYLQLVPCEVDAKQLRSANGWQEGGGDV